MERVRWEEQDGKQILVVDVSGMAADAYGAVLTAGTSVAAEQPPGSVRVATVVTGVRFGIRAGEDVKAYAAHLRPYLKAGAVVGLSPLHQVIYLSVRPFLHASTREFPDLASARTWLAGH